MELKQISLSMKTDSG